MFLKSCRLLAWIAALALLACACGAQAQSIAPTVLPTPGQSAPQASPAQTPDAAPEATAQPTAPQQTDAPPQALAGYQTRLALDRRLPVLDALVRAMGADEDAYAPQDAAFVWRTIYLTAVNFPGTDPAIGRDADTGETLLPAQAALEIARSAFAQLETLPEIPRQMAQSVAYDAQNRVYRLAPSDMDESQTCLAYFETAQDGAVTAAVTLLDPDGLPICQTLFTLSGLQDQLRVSAARSSKNTLSLLDMDAPVFMDLDGDGRDEQITAEASEGELLVTILSRGRQYQQRVAALSGAALYAGDLTAQDRLTELYLCGSQAEAGFVTCMLRFDNSGIQTAALPGQIQAADGFGCIRVLEQAQLLGSYPVTASYRFDARQGAFARVSDYAVVRYAGDWEGRTLTVKRGGLPAFLLENGVQSGPIALAAGTELMLLETDGQTYARLCRKDGALVMILLEKTPEDARCAINGVWQDEWFDLPGAQD